MRQLILRRIRRIKCDESKPSCKRCTSTGRKCDGYASPKVKQQAPVAFLMIVSESGRTECDRQAVHAFQYFYEVCAPALVNHGSGDFWNKLVLQACHAEESIKHLVIAASRLEIVDQPANTQTISDPQFLWHYGKALKLISQAKDPEPEVLLIACLLLVLCDELQQNPYAALQHVTAGRKILLAYCPPHPRKGRCTVVEELGLIFLKLELHIGEIRHQVAPRLYPDTPAPDNSLAKIPNLPHRLQPLSAFRNVADATFVLQNIASDCVSFRYTGRPPKTRFHIARSLTTRLNDWLGRLTLLQADITREEAVRSFRDHNTLLAYHTCLHIMSRCTPYNQEMTYDLYFHQWEHVMASCGRLMSQPTTKILPLLFFVATKYRSASIRRRAVEFLRKCGHNGQLLSSLAMGVIRIEEAGIFDPIVCTDIPDLNRVRIQDVDVDSNGMFYTLYFKRYPYEESSPSDHLTLPSPECSWADPITALNHVVSPSNSFIMKNSSVRITN